MRKLMGNCIQILQVNLRNCEKATMDNQLILDDENFHIPILQKPYSFNSNMEFRYGMTKTQPTTVQSS